MMDTIKIKHGKTLMVAHRGLSGLEKENTAASFIAAGNRSFHGTECDIHLTKDHQYVVCHDGNLKRVAEAEVEIKDTDLKDLYDIKLIDNFDGVKKDYYQVVSFNDYLDINKKYGKFCIIEYKDNFTKEEVQEVIDMIKAKDYLDHVIFISFIQEPLVFTRELLPEIEIQYLRSEFNEEIFEFCKKYHFGLDAQFKCLNKDVIKRYHKEGLKVNAWTVNQKEDALNLVKWKIDYITTNIIE